MAIFSSTQPPRAVDGLSGETVYLAELEKVQIIAPGVVFDAVSEVFYFNDKHMVGEEKRYGVVYQSDTYSLINSNEQSVSLSHGIFLGSGVDFLYYESIVYFVSKLDYLIGLDLAFNKNFILNEDMSPRSKQYFADLLAKLFPNCRVFFASGNMVITVDKLVIIGIDASKIDRNIPRIKQFIVESFPKSNHFPQDVKIMLRRKALVHYDLKWRKPINFMLLELIARLLGFKLIDPADLELNEVAELFGRAKKVVSYHGGALSNILFCPFGVTIIELYSTWYDDCFKKICEATNLVYVGKSFQMYTFPSIPRTIYGLLHFRFKIVQIKHWYVPLNAFLRLIK
jgi:capsular polysaccharide biosynthesis protein